MPPQFEKVHKRNGSKRMILNCTFFAPGSLPFRLKMVESTMSWFGLDDWHCSVPSHWSLDSFIYFDVFLFDLSWARFCFRIYINFMRRLSMSRSPWPIKDDAVFRWLSFFNTYLPYSNVTYFAHGLEMTMMLNTMRATSKINRINETQTRRGDGKKHTK